jgi:hypothetical protein
VEDHELRARLAFLGIQDPQLGVLLLSFVRRDVEAVADLLRDDD